MSLYVINSINAIKTLIPTIFIIASLLGSNFFPPLSAFCCNRDWDAGDERG